MNVIPTALPGVLMLEPRVFADARGYFFESFNQQVFRAATGVEAVFVQDNHSRSSKGVLRGLHYQVEQAQGKLVRVTHGHVFDVVADINPASPHFRQWVGVELSAGNFRQLWIPPGYAHGYLVLSDHAECQYKTTTHYAPEHERCIAWNDPELAIHWPLDPPGTAPLLSAKDAAGLSLAQASTAR